MQNNYQVIGLMSGTSLDGLDMAHCTFTLEGGKWTFTLENSSAVPYDGSLEEKLRHSIDLSAADLLRLDKEYGKWIGDRVREFMLEKDVKVDFTSSHGHTVFHQPDKKLTYQIGAGQELANACGTRVICDYRSLDVSLGGQGAPLVPIGDQLLFPGFDFCLNLGGIANASFQVKGSRVAYDISPANMMLNHLAKKMGKAFDKGGEIARSGNVNETLLHQLDALSYYQKDYPKSLGYEWFCQEVIPVIENCNIAVRDILCTSVHHIAKRIITDLRSYKHKTSAPILVTGGGARNDFLMECLNKYSGDDFEIVIPEPEIIDFKEAIVFAFMGVRRIRNEVNCLKSVTGARQDSSAGVIYEPYH